MHPPPNNPTGGINGPISSALYGGSRTQRASFCHQRKVSCQGTCKYTPSQGPGHVPITMYLRITGRHWKLDGGTFDTPYSYTFWCWGAPGHKSTTLPTLGAGYWKIYVWRIQPKLHEHGVDIDQTARGCCTLYFVHQLRWRLELTWNVIPTSWFKSCLCWVYCVGFHDQEASLDLIFYIIYILVRFNHFWMVSKSSN